jgi:hypothetical protein
LVSRPTRFNRWMCSSCSAIRDRSAAMRSSTPVLLWVMLTDRCCCEIPCPGLLAWAMVPPGRRGVRDPVLIETARHIADVQVASSSRERMSAASPIWGRPITYNLAEEILRRLAFGASRARRPCGEQGHGGSRLRLIVIVEIRIGTPSANGRPPTRVTSPSRCAQQWALAKDAKR